MQHPECDERLRTIEQSGVEIDQDERDHQDHDRSERDQQSARRRCVCLLRDILRGLGGD